jgi:hypothetical protein
LQYWRLLVVFGVAATINKGDIAVTKGADTISPEWVFVGLGGVFRGCNKYLDFRGAALAIGYHLDGFDAKWFTNKLVQERKQSLAVFSPKPCDGPAEWVPRLRMSKKLSGPHRRLSCECWTSHD